MFCACISIIICVSVLICGTTVSIIDISRYDFGLYYALLAIVGLTAAIAVCVVRPRRGCCTRDPQWYTKCCDRLNRCIIAEQRRVAMSRAGLRDGNTYSNVGDGDKRSGASTRQQRATLIMLRPAVELMQHMLHGFVNRDEEDRMKDEEDTSEATDEMSDDSPRTRRSKSKKKKKKRKLQLPANEACLYTILETSTADVTCVPPTEATSIVTVHECYPQLLNDSVPNSPAALLSPTALSIPGKQAFFPQRKHLLNQTSTDSPRMRGVENVFTFQRHDILSETLDEERFSETRCSSTHEG